MVATVPSRLDSLTGLRFFAAQMVVVHHFANFATLPFLWRYQGFGATGVTFFFVLSGFVLTWSFSPIDTKGRFYWRRFARIWPLHALTTLIALPVFYSMRDVPYDWTAIVLSFLLLHAWLPSAGTYFAGNPASWSLSCELFFYAVHPFIVRHAVALKSAALAVSAVALMAAVFAVVRWSPEWLSARVVGWLLYVSPAFRIAEFLLGMALAVAMKRGLRVPIGVIPAALLVAAWFHLEYQVSPRHFSATLQILIDQGAYVALPLLFALLVAATVQLDLRNAPSLMRMRPVVLLGQWSYALYLVHATIIYLLIETIGVRSFSNANVLWLALVTGLSVAASAVLYTAFEYPVEQWLRAFQWSRQSRSRETRPVPGRRPARPASTVPAIRLKRS